MPRGGPRPNSGGARPGAGRKSDPTKAYQTTMRSRFEACVTQEDWDAIIRTLVTEAKAGSVAAFRELAPWIVGRVPEEVALEQAGGLALDLDVRQRLDLSRLTVAELADLERLLDRATPDAG